MNEQRREGEPPAGEQGPGQSLSAKDLFLGLIHSFQAAAMQQMGKVPNPYTQKIERDLPQAKLSIDVLEMLQTRTSGNLVGEEARFLQHVLTELRLNYVAELEDDKKGKSGPPPAAGTPPPPSAPE
ncbi:MAG TPA: DUF1844 domain-containing protein [Candidatus Eisenbacteria bacterium]|nr:DUF1844 domain-containing protein [Candidatus Eisenbacteria bacterium]